MPFWKEGMPHMLVIREFSFSDIDAITELMDDLGHPATKEQMIKRMENISSNPMYCTYVAEHEGNVVGMVGLRQLYSYEGDNVAVQISALVTKANYRGKGIGKELVRQAEKWAKENGANVIVLTSGNRPEREDAHQFYNHLGYNVTGLRFVKKLQ
jgi:GNAT superfamily N-acetyltransferase